MNILTGEKQFNESVKLVQEEPVKLMNTSVLEWAVLLYINSDEYNNNSAFFICAVSVSELIPISRKEKHSLSVHSRQRYQFCCAMFL